MMLLVCSGVKLDFLEHTYNKDYHIDDYIKSAGYLNERANKERILVIKANGKLKRFDAKYV